MNRRSPVWVLCLTFPVVRISIVKCWFRLREIFIFAEHLKHISVLLVLNGRNGFLASTACTCSKTVLSSEPNAHFQFHEQVADPAVCGTSQAYTLNIFNEPAKVELSCRLRALLHVRAWQYHLELLEENMSMPGLCSVLCDTFVACNLLVSLHIIPFTEGSECLSLHRGVSFVVTLPTLWEGGWDYTFHS
jgi:hypothetical protein